MCFVYAKVHIFIGYLPFYYKEDRHFYTYIIEGKFDGQSSNISYELT